MGGTWQMTHALDQGAHYTVVATATSTAGSTSTSTTTFTTVTAEARLLTGMTPLDGAVVGVGETIDLRFNTAIPAACVLRSSSASRSRRTPRSSAAGTG